MIQGIDVSGHNPATYSTAGLDFVFVKATEGQSYVSPAMSRQAAVARSAGLVLGFYHFLHAGNTDAQAQYFVAKCPALPGEILVCDWETPPGAPAASNAEKDAFIRKVKELRPGHKVLLYCNRDFWKTHDTTSYAGDGLWIADPGATAGKPKIQHPWTVHQYGTIAKTDRDVANFASRAAMKAWAGYPSAPKPVPPATPTLATLAAAVDQLNSNVSALAVRVSVLEQA
jgi:GH25 family lysozyme M1 (1,4-beta-N-acetylmuramidase)